MHRSLRRALIALPLFAIACGDDQSTAPTTPHAYVASTSTISQQIDALYPITLGHRDAAQAKWRALQDAIAKDKPNQRSRLMHLIDWTLKREKEGVLSDPNGAAPPSTRLAVSILTASLYQAVYPDAPAPPIVEDGVDIGAGVVDPGVETIIVSEQSQAGGEFEVGTWTQPVLVTFVEQPDPSSGGGGPLPTERYKQYPKFYEITAFPNDPTHKDIRIGICHVTDEESPYFPPEPHSQLRVAKEKEVGEGTELLVLDRVEVADFLNCVDVSAEEPFIIGSANATGVRGLAMRALERAAKGLASIVTPKPLYAIDQGIGGVLQTTIDDADPTGGFSLFGLIDINTEVAACATSMPGYTTFASVADAVAATSPGGTTYICNGTYVVDDVALNKPITVRSFPGGNVTLQQSPGSITSIFRIDGISSGTVRVTGLRFEPTWVGVWAEGAYDQVIADSNSYSTLEGGVAGIYAGTSSVAGARTTVRHSSFSGGDVGTFAHDALMDVFHSRFDSHEFSGIQHQARARGRVQYNISKNCGSNGCIRARFTTSMEILDNSVAASQSRRLRFGIIADTGAVLIQRNTITGLKAPGDAETVMSSDPSQYPIFEAAISVGYAGPDLTTGTVSHNRIQGAYRGIWLNSGTIRGSNMTMDSVGIAFEVGANSSLTVGESDLRTYYAPFAQPPVATTPSTLVLTCNWWGTTAGNPYNVPDDAGTNVFIPWASAPIANGAGGLCDGDFSDRGEGCEICSPELSATPDGLHISSATKLARSPQSLNRPGIVAARRITSSAAMETTLTTRSSVPPLQ